jgi:nucleoside-diphosphate-sugar epimerase
MRRVLVTGSAGLVGGAMVRALATEGCEVVGLDLRHPYENPWQGDVLDPARLARAMAEVDGILHLAAVSRVISAEREPELCWRTNVEGTANLLRQALAARQRPWVVFASSREVYGEQSSSCVAETADLAPMNIYARAKVAGERLIDEAVRAGLRAASVRLSNVYGDIRDHADRMVPAFVRAVLTGARLRLEGPDNCFDLTHVDDVARGLSKIAELLDRGESLPVVHLVSGRGVRLRELAALVGTLAGRTIHMDCFPARDFDVKHFIGDPTRARTVLGWTAEMPLETGLARLVEDFSRALAERGVLGHDPAPEVQLQRR